MLVKKAAVVVFESSHWLGDINSYSAAMTSDTWIMVCFIISRSPLGDALLRNWTRPFRLQTAADVLLTMSFEHIYMTSSILIFIQYNQALKNSTF